MFGWEFPPYNSGGLGTACRGLIRGLVASGVEVILVLPKKIPLEDPPCRVVFASDEYEEVSADGTPVLMSAYQTVDGYYRLRREHYGGSTSSGLSLYEEVKQYGRAARSVARGLAGQFDVIHAHDWLTFEAGAAAREVSGRPLVSQVHATEFDRGGGRSINQRIYNIEHTGVQAADRVISVSQFTKNILTSHYGVAPEKVVPIHNGIDVSEYPAEAITAREILQLKAHGFKLVLFLGRLTLQKGPDYFIRVAERVLQHEPSTFFALVGSGDMRQQLAREVAARGLSRRFILEGFTRGQAQRQLYASADLFIMPSVSEPFGITPLESMIERTPVLISKQSGVSECVSHALKADFWDVDDMASQAVALLRYPGLARTLEENGYRNALQQSWHKAAAKVRELYGS